MKKKVWFSVTGIVLAVVAVSFAGVSLSRRLTARQVVTAQLTVQEKHTEEESISEQMTAEEVLSESVFETSDFVDNSVETVEQETDETEEFTEDQDESEMMSETVDDGADTLVSPITEIVDNYLESRLLSGERWAVSIEDLSTGEVYNYHAEDQLQSASVIKVFIMGAVYDRILSPSSEESAIFAAEYNESDLRYLISQMITVSDNDCANRLVEILGGGSFETGAAVVDEFCAAHGYRQTHMGRRFLASNPTDDNYISAKDCRMILSDIYHGRLVSESASEEMEAYLQGQTRTGKIPSGLPSGFSSANKTGEMYSDYGLGSIENDMAIIYSPYGDYVLTVISGELDGRNSEAISVINQISAYTAQWFMLTHETNEEVNAGELIEEDGLIAEG